MRQEMTTRNGTPIVLIVPRKHRKRMYRTCFRGSLANKSGNFRQWEEAADLLQDDWVLPSLLEHIEHAIDHRMSTLRVTIQTKIFVGWASTIDFDDVPYCETEEFSPNKRSVARRVVRGSKVRAPGTKELTIVVTLKRDKGENIAMVQTIYPGPDVGRLNGDVTGETGMVFFDFDHFGDPIAFAVNG